MAMNESADDVPQETLSGEWVSRDDVVVNDWNPNEMASDKKRELRESILNTGWTQPIVVRENTTDTDAQYEVIDGEQRLHVSGHSEIAENGDLTPVGVEMGLVPVHCIGVGETQAKSATLQHNRARGHIDYNEFSEMLQDLEGDEVETTKQVLASTDDEVIDMLRDEETASERFGQNDDYSPTWRPTPTHEVGDLDTESMSDSITVHSTGDDPDDDELSSQSSGSSNDTIETRRIICILREDEHQTVVNTLGYEDGANRLLGLLDDMHSDEELFDSFIQQFGDATEEIGEDTDS